jgi:hypothetical protein
MAFLRILEKNYDPARIPLGRARERIAYIHRKCAAHWRRMGERTRALAHLREAASLHPWSPRIFAERIQAWLLNDRSGQNWGRHIEREVGRYELAATDLIGNVRLERFEVRLDQTPPALLDYRLAPDPLAAGSGHLIEVEASDPSGMLQAAAFTLEVDGRTESGFLNLDPASGRYLARVVLAQPAGAPLRLRDVVLEDYAGNRRRYMIE